MTERYSEPYTATGGLAAEGVLNQLGRPDIEPLEVLVREAVQNCWDAKRSSVGGVRVEIGREVLEGAAFETCRSELLVDPPPGLPLAQELRTGLELLYFADFGTDGLGGPTRADETGLKRDFVDFVLNIGQPPDKDLGGGSFGYGKAAFYIASRARTILVDTACVNDGGAIERRFIGCGLGANFDLEGRPYTGRHWWGDIENGNVGPLVGAAAERAAGALGLPDRSGETGLGTTVVVVAPGLAPEANGEDDETMRFIADALAWNFWPRMIDTPGAGNRSMDFKVLDCGTQVRVPNPRTHPRLRAFVDAMDRQREEPGDDDDLVFDRSIESRRPARRLGRLVVQRDPVAPADLPDRAVPQGARLTNDSLHHVALMRNAELVVKYQPGPVPVTGRLGYAGVFKCAVDVDEAFRSAEPPTHDDWIYRALPRGQQRSFVKIALERVAGVCREAAGYDSVVAGGSESAEVPLGEFADSMASLMAGSSGMGARQAARPGPKSRRKRVPGRTAVQEQAAEVWVDAGLDDGNTARETPPGGDPRDSNLPGVERPRLPPPQVRAPADAGPALGSDGTAVMRYPFELRCLGNSVRIHARVEVMANDGGQTESEAPAGAPEATVSAWIDPSGAEHRSATVETDSEQGDGQWAVEIPILEETMMRVDLAVEVL